MVGSFFGGAGCKPDTDGGPGSPSDDFLSAVYCIQDTELFTIPLNRQMVVFECLEIKVGGELIIEGQLFLEP